MVGTVYKGRAFIGEKAKKGNKQNNEGANSNNKCDFFGVRIYENEKEDAIY